MECSNKDILFQAAEAWMDLTQYRYIFTYGYKNKLYTITLGFTPSDFPHLAGFQYMKDIAAPRFSPNKLLKKILDGTVDTAPFLRAAQFENDVVPRLHAIMRLKESLDSEFTLFKYMSQFYSFYTNIKANYLISSHIDNTDFISSSILRMDLPPLNIPVVQFSRKPDETLKKGNVNAHCLKKSASISPRTKPIFFMIGYPPSLKSNQIYCTRIFHPT